MRREETGPESATSMNLILPVKALIDCHAPSSGAFVPESLQNVLGFIRPTRCCPVGTFSFTQEHMAHTALVIRMLLPVMSQCTDEKWSAHKREASHTKPTIVCSHGRSCWMAPMGSPRQMGQECGVTSCLAPTGCHKPSMTSSHLN